MRVNGRDSTLSKRKCRCRAASNIQGDVPLFRQRNKILIHKRKTSLRGVTPSSTFAPFMGLFFSKTVTWQKKKLHLKIVDYSIFEHETYFQPSLGST